MTIHRTADAMRSIAILLLFVAELPVLRAQVPTRKQPELTEGSRLAVPGGRIWYRLTGTGAGTPVVLLHGGPGNPSVYLKSLEALGNERIVVRYDQLGAGYSDVVHDTSVFTIPHYVQELELLRRHLGVDRVHLYGHSWGATLAVEYYRAHPSHVTSMILAGETLDLPAFAANVRRIFAEMPESLSRAVRQRSAGEAYDTVAMQAAMRRFRSHFAHSPVAAEADTLARLSNPEISNYMNGTSPFAPTGTLRQYDATPFLRQIKVPVLFIVGEFDVAGPDNIRRHASVTPNSKLVVIPKAGHHTQWDDLSATLAAVRSFLREVESRP
jgi:proline iminopeptidase